MKRLSSALLLLSFFFALSCGGEVKQAPDATGGGGGSSGGAPSGGASSGGAPPILVPPLEPDPYDTCTLYVTDVMWQREGGRLFEEEAAVVCAACDRAVVECSKMGRCWMAYCFPGEDCTCSEGALCIEETLVASFERFRWSNNCLALQPGYGGHGGGAD